MYNKQILVERHGGLSPTFLSPLVQMCHELDDVVYMSHNGSRVNCRSILGLMSLCVLEGDVATLECNDEVVLEEISKYLLKV